MFSSMIEGVQPWIGGIGTRCPIPYIWGGKNLEWKLSGLELLVIHN